MCQHHIHIDTNNRGICTICGDKFKFKTFEEINYEKRGNYGSSNPNPVIPFYMMQTHSRNIVDQIYQSAEQQMWRE